MRHPHSYDTHEGMLTSSPVSVNAFSQVKLFLLPPLTRQQDNDSKESKSLESRSLFKPEIKSKSLSIDSRLPVSLSPIQFAVSLMHREGIVLMSKDG